MMPQAQRAPSLMLKEGLSLAHTHTPHVHKCILILKHGDECKLSIELYHTADILVFLVHKSIGIKQRLMSNIDWCFSKCDFFVGIFNFLTVN